MPYFIFKNDKEIRFDKPSSDLISDWEKIKIAVDDNKVYFYKTTKETSKHESAHLREYSKIKTIRKKALQEFLNKNNMSNGYYKINSITDDVIEIDISEKYSKREKEFEKRISKNT